MSNINNRNVDVLTIEEILTLLVPSFSNNLIGLGGLVISFAPIAFWNSK